jgi:hypothetical protein
MKDWDLENAHLGRADKIHIVGDLCLPPKLRPSTASARNCAESSLRPSESASIKVKLLLRLGQHRTEDA